MKRALILASVLFLTFFAALSTMAENATNEKGYISVNESTVIEVSPNQVEITVGIETSDKSLQKASEENKIIANRVYSSLKQLIGVTDYIKTSDYSAKPQYHYTIDNKKIIDKYIVLNDVKVKTKKTELVSKLIDTAIAQGATNINNLGFTATDYDDICKITLNELTKKAYSQADSVAKTVNSQITGIKSINATCNQENNQRPYMMMAKGSVDSVSATPIESGKIKINANVDTSFFVK